MRTDGEGVQLEFVGTECLRPGVCAESWGSFRENLVGVDWPRSTLYLNIDCCPARWEPAAPRAEQVRDEAAKVFGRVLSRVCSKPSFPSAVAWGWRQPTGPEFFYLQADWVLTRPVDVRDLLSLLWSTDDGEQYEWSAVNLRAYNDNHHRVCLSPVLIKSSVAATIAEQLDDSAGPEAQMRAPEFREGGRGLGEPYRSYHWPLRQDGIVVKDIGREWLKKRGIEHKGGKAFVTWQGG